MTEAKTPEKTRQMTFTVLESGIVRADFDGQEPLFLEPGLIPEHIQGAAMTEGLISRTRGYTSKLEGEGRTPAALRDAVAKGFAQLMAGIWKIERAASASFTLEQEAAHVFKLMRAKVTGVEYTGTPAESAMAFDALTDEQKKTLKALPRYQLAYAEVKAAAAAAKAQKLQDDIAKSEENGEDTF